MSSSSRSPLPADAGRSSRCAGGKCTDAGLRMGLLFCLGCLMTGICAAFSVLMFFSPLPAVAMPKPRENERLMAPPDKLARFIRSQRDHRVQALRERQLRFFHYARYLPLDEIEDLPTENPANPKPLYTLPPATPAATPLEQPE